MPKLKDSQIDLRRMESVAPENTATDPMPAPPAISPTSPFMISSLPPLGASYDQFVRQFYGRGQFPLHRIFGASLK